MSKPLARTASLIAISEAPRAHILRIVAIARCSVGAVGLAEPPAERPRAALVPAVAPQVALHSSSFTERPVEVVGLGFLGLFIGEVVDWVAPRSP